jgi:hypothetical protein
MDRLPTRNHPGKLVSIVEATIEEVQPELEGWCRNGNNFLRNRTAKDTGFMPPRDVS